MDLSEKATAQVVSIDSSQEDRQQVLEKAIGTVDALKRLISAYDRMKEERDNFQRDLGKVSAENEVLRKQANDAKVHRDRLSQIVTTFVGHMETIGASCMEAAKVARVHASGGPEIAPASLPTTDPGTLASTVELEDAPHLMDDSELKHVQRFAEPIAEDRAPPNPAGAAQLLVQYLNLAK
jgi:hypothetical protein